MKPEEPKKWYAVLKRIQMVKEKEIAKQISDETTINRKEAEMALAQFEKVLIRELLNGNSVQLGDWGSFQLTCNSTGHDTKEEVTASSVKKLNILFQSGQRVEGSHCQGFLKGFGNLARKQTGRRINLPYF